MINSIYLNGCSYVAGAMLPQHELGSSQVIGDVGKLIHEEFNLKHYINDAKGGASNDRIRRRTIDWVLKNIHYQKDFLVVIGWTQFTRFELVDDFAINDIKQPHKYLQLNSGLAINRENFDWWYREMNPKQKDLPKNSIRHIVRFGMGQDFYDFPKDFYRNFMVRHYDVDDRYDKYLDNILYTQSILKSHDIKYVMFDSLWSINEATLAKKFSNKYNQIDFNQWVWGDNRTSWTEHLSVIDPENKKTRASKDDDHPNTLGHKIWSERCIEKIKDIYGDFIR